MIYLDHSSSTFIEKEVLDTYIKVESDYFANADSLHTLGFNNKKLFELSRQKIADLLCVLPEEIIFTSGASESNSLAIVGYYKEYKERGKHILVACGEHSSTKGALNSLEDAEIEEIPLCGDGNIDLDDLKKRIRKDTILVCISGIQNEFGSIRDISAIGELCHRNEVALFVDAAQMVGKIGCDFSQCDLVSISAHKLHGLKGSGILIKKKSIRLSPIIFGGQQEYGLRGGSSNVAHGVAFAKALRLALEHQKKYASHIRLLNKTLREKLKSFDNVVINSDENASDYILSFSCLNLPSQVLLNAFNQNQIYLSAISTCVTKRKATSSVACITKDEKRIKGVLRVSFSYQNTLDEIEVFIQTLHKILKDYGV